MKEEEIRPKKIFEEYLDLCKEDIKNFFVSKQQININCPACNKKGKLAFVKNNFSYEKCLGCKTLYVSPRPPEEEFQNYYLNAQSTQFWATTFYKETEDARRKKIWKPKAKQILKIIDNLQLYKYSLVDIGGGYGTFAEEFKKINKSSTIIIEPNPKLADVCRKKGLYVIQKFFENIKRNDLPKGLKIFVCFELFEHVYNPKEFLSNIKSIMNPKDILILTTLSGLGLDIQVLGKDSMSVSPPHHLNFFNPLSFNLILQKLNFDIVDISTPGKLDIDILQNNKNKIRDVFWRNLIEFSSIKDKRRWQKLISSSNWSSHIMIVARK